MSLCTLNYDVLVVGSGHAGCEAAVASARAGASTVLLTMNLDNIAKMSCNPAIGGIGKGHIVREIDALGGVMPKVIDSTGIQFRMLNSTKGPAVQSPRAQADKHAYSHEMKHILENIDNLVLIQGTAKEFLVKDDQIYGVTTEEGLCFIVKSVVLCAGTFMQGVLHIGEIQSPGGRMGDNASNAISDSLKKLGFKLGRLKTGTPPRVHGRTIDFSSMEEQPSEDGVFFSYENEFNPSKLKRLKQVSCFISYTSQETHDIIRDNLKQSPVYSGQIQSKGPRYCPSIEDKIVRFPDRERHQIFLEPEGLKTTEFYLNGISTSLPPYIQFKMIQSIPGLEKAVISRPAYAIEYDYVLGHQILSTLESTLIQGLFFAGQINGTTGYEEAAGQGILAGINAASRVLGKPPLTLQKHESYIGVMIDDLITKPQTEPYRMFTGRSEFRLILRQDNADARLRKYGYEYGLVSKDILNQTNEKKELVSSEIRRLKSCHVPYDSKTFSLARLLTRPEISYQDLQLLFPDKIHTYRSDITKQIEWDIKYEGYCIKQTELIERQLNSLSLTIPKLIDYKIIAGLRSEAVEKLSLHLPETIGQASRIPGVYAADVQILLIFLREKNGSVLSSNS